MQMKNSILGMGLAALLGGCNKTDVSVTDEKVHLTKPEGCQTVEDIRYYASAHGYRGYQVLCRDADGNLSLYTRSTDAGSWREIEVR